MNKLFYHNLIKHLCNTIKHHKQSILFGRDENDKSWNYYKLRIRELIEANFCKKCWSLKTALQLFDQGLLSYEPYSIMIQELNCENELIDTYNLVETFGNYYSAETLGILLYENNAILTKKNIAEIFKLETEEIIYFGKILNQQPIYTQNKDQYPEIKFFELPTPEELKTRLENSDDTLDLQIITAVLNSEEFASNEVVTLKEINTILFLNKNLTLYFKNSKAYDAFKFFEIAQIGDIKLLSYYREENVELISELLDDIFTDQLDILNTIPLITKNDFWSKNYFKKMRNKLTEVINSNLELKVEDDLVEKSLSRRLDYLETIIEILDGVKRKYDIGISDQELYLFFRDISTYISDGIFKNISTSTYNPYDQEFVENYYRDIEKKTKKRKLDYNQDHFGVDVEHEQLDKKYQKKEYVKPEDSRIK